MRPPLVRTLLRLGLSLAALAIARGAGADPALQRRLAREAPSAVAAEWRRALDARPYDLSLWVGLAEVERFRCDLPASRAALARVLARDPLDAAARAGLAEAFLFEARGEESLAETDLGLALPAGRLEPELWRVRSLALVELRRYAEAREAAGRATALAPGDARAWEALARAAFHECDMDASRRAYVRAAELEPYSEEANQRLGNGFAEETLGRSWEKEAAGEAFRHALLRWQAGQLETARDGFGELARAFPTVFKFRLGLGSVLAERRRQHEAWGGARARDLYGLLPAPEVPELTRVLPDYPRLSRREQHVVRVVTAPLRPWWPALIRAGATHDLMSVTENLGDREPREGLRGRLTFDGRCYDHVRGVGGLNAATGVEKLDEGADLAFQTLAHEIAHQVLTYALPAELAARVKVLYALAAAEGRFLDYYAASNVDEYFAQGYEALISHVKRGCLKETQRHTRAELRARDPAFFAFLMETFDLSHETPESMSAFRTALAAEAAVTAPPTPR
jgi:cytochrome c-type biogenesis protein CcmH/NrfG